jgi:hypothetical protein
VPSAWAADGGDGEQRQAVAARRPPAILPPPRPVVAQAVSASTAVFHQSATAGSGPTATL